MERRLGLGKHGKLSAEITSVSVNITITESREGDEYGDYRQELKLNILPDGVRVEPYTLEAWGRMVGREGMGNGPSVAQIAALNQLVALINQSIALYGLLERLQGDEGLKECMGKLV